MISRLQEAKRNGVRSSRSIFCLLVLSLVIVVGAITPSEALAYETPAGYNDHDYQKIVAFLEQKDETGVKNGQKLADDYAPENPPTWGTDKWGNNNIVWNNDDPANRQLGRIILGGRDLVGEIDLSGCAALVEVSFFGNRISKANFSNCLLLSSINCSNNRLTSLALSGLANLAKLYCGGNQLTELSLQDCLALKELGCYQNQLAKLDLSALFASLVELNCYNNDLTELKIANFGVLEDLNCRGNRLTSLDLTGCNDLSEVDCSENRLTKLYVNHLPKLINLQAWNNQLTSLDVTGLSDLSILDCHENRLTELKLTGLRSLNYLGCSDNKLTELDLADLRSVQFFDCHDNYLSFKSLPKELPVAGGIYRYAPQREIPIGDSGEIFVGTIIDFSEEFTIGTKFTWMETWDDEELTPTTAEGGRFSFGEEFLWYEIKGVLTNPAFPELTLSTVNITISGPEWPSISQDPQSQAVRLGERASFQIAVESPTDGGVLSYQWEERSLSGTWAKISGATARTYQTPPTTASDQGKRFRCVVTNTYRGFQTEATSSSATLNILGAPVISSHPITQTVRLGGTARFIVEAEIPETGTLSYQWQTRKHDEETTLPWVDLAGANTSSYELSGTKLADEEAQFRCLVSVTVSGEKLVTASKSARLYLVLDPEITLQPKNQTVKQGEDAAFLVDAEPVGGGVLGFKWQVKALGGEWADLAGETSDPDLGIGPVSAADQGKQYRCRVYTERNDVLSPGIFSEPATLTVVTEPVISKDLENVYVKSGDVASFTVTASSPCAGTLSYQWQSRLGTSEWKDLSGAQTATYQTGAAKIGDSGREYRCILKNSKDGIESDLLISKIAVLTIVQEPTITKQPESTTIKLGAKVTFTVAATSPDGGSLSYQWQFKKGEGAWTTINEATAASFEIATAISEDNGKQYRCLVANVLSGVSSHQIQSAPTVLTVVQEPTITKQPENQTVRRGGQATFTVLATSSDEGTLSYQWQVKNSDGIWADLEGAQSKSYVLAAVLAEQSGKEFRVMVFNSKNGVKSTGINSASASLTVVKEARITSQPQSQSAILGSTVTFRITAVAADQGTLHYQWQTRLGESSWTDLQGAVQTSYTTPSVSPDDAGRKYRCAVTNSLNSVSADQVFSEGATLTIAEYALSILQPFNGGALEINNGSLVIAVLNGDLDGITIMISLDDAPAVEAPLSGSNIYYLLPAFLEPGEHHLAITAKNGESQVAKAEILFTWDNYRKGFGFGRFSFEEE